MAACRFTPLKPVHQSSKSVAPTLRPLCRAMTVMLAAGATAGAHAGAIINLSHVATQMSAGGGAAGASGNSNLGISPQQALSASQPSIQNLARAAQGIAQQMAAQQAAAAAAAAAPSNVPNGLAVGGLQVAPGVSFDSNNAPTTATANPSNPTLWINANGPQQTVNPNGTVNVNVKQTAPDAVLTWQTMNVGKQTTLNFDQSGGTQTNGANNWIVLNRIQDPSGAPSQILGNVTAQGTVLVLNRNGILFGAGSQVNVHSLVASSLDVLNANDDLVQSGTDIAASNKSFLNGGLAVLEAGETQPAGASSAGANEILGLGNNVSISSASQYQAPGSITIAPGASITTHANGTASDGGLVLVAAPGVNNGGSITATDGQVILAAGVGVSLTPNATNPQILLPELTGRIAVGSGGSAIDITPVSNLNNTGLIQAARGNIDLLGTNVNQNGVVGATTSVSSPGGIVISTVDEYIANTPTGTSYIVSTPPVTLADGGDATNRAGQLIFGNGSLTAVLPDTDGQTATSAPGTVFTPGSITMTAGSVWFQSGSLIEAPGSTVSVAALTPSAALDLTPPGDTAVQGRIFVDTGATIDVSGLANVELPISSILLDVGTINENDLANSPLLRDSFLNGLTGVVVDSTLSGTNADGLQWVGSPILNLAGAVNLIPRTVDQLLTNGGSITLSGNQVMTADGSSLNLNGGYVHYLGGMVNTTRLIDASGAIVPIGQADPNDIYVGIAGEFIENHPRWQVTNDWFNPLLSGGAYESDYIVGGNAGTLNVFASQSMVLDGSITAQAFGGSNQVQGNNQPVGGNFNLGADAAGTLAGLTQGVNTSATGESSTVILQNSAPQLSSLSPDFTANTPLDTTALNSLGSTDPNNVLATMVVPVNTLNSGGFANVSVTEDVFGGKGILVAAGTQLAVQPGGSITLKNPDTSGQIDVLGSLSAPSGTISISTGGGNIAVGPNGSISVAGQWVNNDTQSTPATVPGDSEFINGGSVKLSTAQASSGGADTSGSILLENGSVIDVSSGGEILADGQMLTQNDIAEGMGGNLSLLTYTGAAFGSGDGAPNLPASQPGAGRIEMDGSIDSFGFAGGGTLTLQGLGFQIGGDPSQAPSWDLALPVDFFSRQGFGKYVLNAMYDTTVAPGATVQLTQQNLLPNVPALQQAVSGSNLSADGLTTLGTLDSYHRQATDLVLTAGGYLAWRTPAGTPPAYADAGVTGAVTEAQGASIIGDAGASIGLGSPAQVTVLGSIIAPGGSITLSADSENAQFSQSGQLLSTGFTSVSKSVWLGPDAVLDVAGVALTDPLAAPVKQGFGAVVPDTGKVLPGGTVVISDDSGFVVAQAGSLIDVSGTSASFDELQSNGQYAPQQVWSNAGSITLGASSGLYFDGSLQAQPGASQAQGGSLTLLPEQSSVSSAQQPGGGLPVASPPAQVLILQQSGDLVPAGLMPGQDFPGEFTTTSSNGKQTLHTSYGVLQFSVDKLAGSGIANLVIDGSQNVSDAAVPIAFEGNVNLSLPGSVILNTGRLVALTSAEVNSLLAGSDTLSPPPSASSSTAPPQLLTAGSTPLGAPTVTITAPYIAIIGPSLIGSSTELAPVEALGDATLNLNASFIDLENQFQLNNFGQANFVSSGDIRLTSTNGVLNGSNALLPGELFTPGNLSFQAADLYPSTGSTFILDAVGPSQAPTSITFLANGTSGVPLSAGGTLLVDATDIVQAGTVRAPAGSLVFGVGDPTNTGTQAQFNSLPLVATDNVTLAGGSVSSVSLDGAIIPFGTTVDGVEWQFNPVSNASAAPDLTAPPAKFIGVSGSNVTLSQGATVDLSGGGDLQAEEFVPGTGGTRDLLSQFNVSFASNPSGVAVPVNPGAGNVYAILPGAQAPVAAYDPVLAQTVQPLTNSNGTATTITDSIGVGRAALTSEVGQSVYLAGVPGLAAGFYTLLPAKYATLPGAFRVTLSGDSGPVMPGSSQTLPDGTVAVAGYLGNALTGSRSATPILFDVQSGAVWQQYSQYTLTGANAFFPPLAANAGSVTPPLPMDAGQLVLAATQGLTLGATLNTAAAAGGAPAEVDIASQDIQIVGNAATAGEAALPGYLQISADQLDALGAGSLLIGGTRTQTSSGITVDAIANSVVVSNDAADPLSGPEVILVTKVGSTATDPNAANGLRVDAGSVITAQGSFPAAKDQPITIGNTATSGSGDGALLSVSNGGQAVVTRLDSNGTGLLTVGAGAVLTGGQALTLDSSGNLSFDPSATLSAKDIAVDGSAITFTDQSGAAAAALPGFVVGATQLAQLANAQQVTLRSSGAMNFDGSVDVTFGNAVDLSAGTFVSDGGAVTLNAAQVELTNEMGAPVSTGIAGTGTLTVNAKEVDFGTGDKTVSGFDAVTINASGGIVGQGTGTFDFGALPVTLNAPVYLADTNSAATIKTSGTLNLNSAAGTALALTPVGGALSFIGGTLNDNGATIEAPAGNVSLEASSGDLTIGSGSVVSSAGVSKVFFDQTEFAPAGAITLTADTGTVNVAAGSTLDFSGASGGGAAGSLTLSAPDQAVQLAGTLKGSAASGFLGGSFSLNTGGAVDLDKLSTELASSGVNDGISVQSNAGNLILSAGNTLTAHTVSLTADGGAGGQDPNNGQVQILGTINAAGNAGGEIDLYGKSGVDLEGSLIASGTSATELGGNVNLGTSAPFDTTSVNPTYGYENIAAASSGVITLGSHAVIDVSGGTAGGLSGGTVNIVAPLLENGGVNVTLAPTAQIKGARSVGLEAYAVWNTDDQSTGAQHFDGIVDPAGWYGSNGNLVAGTFTVQSTSGTPVTLTYTPNGDPQGGGTLTNNATGVTTTVTAAQLENGDPAIGFGGLTSDFFSPTTADTNHQTFYGYQGGNATSAIPGTLMGFVENGVQSVANQFAGSNIANFSVVPGINLDNPDPAINSGNISILTNWNLGAGTTPDNLAFRFNGQAPVITFKAVNNVEVDASLTDGFFQIANPTGSVPTIPVPVAFYYNNGTNGTFEEYNSTLLGTGAPFSAYSNANGYNYGITAPASFSSFPAADAAEIAQYEGQYNAYFQYLAHTIPLNGGESAFPAAVGFNNTQTPLVGQPTLTVAPPTVAQAMQDPTLYLKYLADWESVFTALVNLEVGSSAVGSLPMLQPPPVALAPVIQGTTIANGSVVTDNSPSPAAAAGNALPLASASLNGGPSSTFKLVAGSDLSSANPLALQAAALFSAAAGTPLANGGNVTLDGHFAYDNATDPTSPNNLILLAPTMIRTGTGSIDIAAGNDVALLDSTAPGVIYTAGVPAAGAPVGGAATIVAGNAASGIPDILVSSAVNPDAGGNISIHAQNDISGIENVVDTSGAVSGLANTNISQFWWQWMEIGNPTASNGQITQTSIDFGAFDQGVMSVGGNVSISAGGNITDLAVSLPTTWYLTNNNATVNTVGGGNLMVAAGGNILSGDYFVAQGTATITAGGQIAPDFSIPGGSGQVAPVATLLATQDGILNVSARQGANIGGVFDPSYIESNALLDVYSQHADFQGYSTTSAVNVSTTTGNVDFGTLGSSTLIGGGASSDLSYILPATVSLTAFNGGITVASGGELFPSASGNLSLIADQSIDLSGQNGSLTALGLLDVDPSAMPSPTDPGASIAELGTSASDSSTAHAQSPLHADDLIPVRIYSLTGSIVDGVSEPAGAANAGFYDKLVNLVVDKPALIEAGDDILNLAFQGQNLRDDDVTRIVAGQDIDDTPLPPNTKVIPSLQLGGPGTFDIEAGRNIGPLTNVQQQVDSQGASFVSTATGIDAVGNANNPNLPHDSANVQVLFGVGPGIDDTDFISSYINPANTVAGVPSSASALVSFMEQYDAGHTVDTGLVANQPPLQTLSVAAAWSQFQALPAYVQQLFAEQVFFSVLTDVGNDFNNKSSPFYNQYARGFQAINTLFPASLGYTANNLGGGGNGANAPVQTGNLDIRSTTIQTQQGGNVSILGPGGEALVGSTSAPPEIVGSNGQVVAGPGTQGILTLEQGDIDIFTDQSLLLAQSRVFTEQGGNMTIWSSNGDINAGKGSTSSADITPPEYVCDVNHYCTLDVKGEVTGAGIATLQSIPGATAGNINLLAPRGTVDAGAAGIRFSGNLNIAALQVLNAANISGQGKETGVPTVSAVDAGALTAASSATSAVMQVAQNLVRNNAGGLAQRHWSISVEVEGFGDPNDDDDNDSDDSKKKKRKGESVGYNPNSFLQVVGHGALSPQQLTKLGDAAHLSEAERRSVEQNQ